MSEQQTPTLAAMAALARGDDATAAAVLTPSRIEAGQAAAMAVLSSAFDRLPAALEGRDSTPSTPFLEAHGFRVTGPCDDLFVGVVPPDGWSLRPGWMDQVLEAAAPDGIARFLVFHKAALYDRQAHVRPLPRYFVALQRLDASGAPTDDTASVAFRRFVVSDAAGPSPHEGEPFAVCPRNAPRDAWAAYVETANRAEAEAEAWLSANRPAWRDPAAYWNGTAAPTQA